MVDSIAAVFLLIVFVKSAKALFNSKLLSLNFTFPSEIAVLISSLEIPHWLEKFSISLLFSADKTLACCIVEASLSVLKLATCF